ncbi:unnamed protein product, partial [Arabidopsis halleri]
LFARASGLKISMEKSTIFLAGLSTLNKDAVLHRYPFASGALPVRYLGIPL